MIKEEIIMNSSGKPKKVKDLLWNCSQLSCSSGSWGGAELGDVGWAGRSRWRRRCHPLTFNLEGLKAAVCNNFCQETLWTVKTEHGSGFMFQVGMILCNFTSNHPARDVAGTHGSKTRACSSDRCWVVRGCCTESAVLSRMAFSITLQIQS